MKINLVAFAVAVGILAALGYGLKVGLTPTDLAKEDPRRVFESFVCKPAPESAMKIHARGVVAFAGGDAIIDFEIDPRDCDELLKRGGFRPAADKDWQWVGEFQPAGTTEEGGISRYVRDSETRQSALFIAKDRRRAWFREIQF
jgi:hypothetical protein